MSAKERDIYKERRRYPKLWQEAIKRAFPRSDPSALELVTVTTASEEQAEREAKLAAEYNALKERGIEEGWLQWEGAYDKAWPGIGAHTVWLDNEEYLWTFYDNEIEAIEEQEA